MWQAALQEAEAAPLPAGKGRGGCPTEESAFPLQRPMRSRDEPSIGRPRPRHAVLQSVAAASADDSAGVVADEVEDDEPEFGDAEPGETESSEVFPDGDEAQSKTARSPAAVALISRPLDLFC